MEERDTGADSCRPPPLSGIAKNMSFSGPRSSRGLGDGGTGGTRSPVVGVGESDSRDSGDCEIRAASSPVSKPSPALIGCPACVLRWSALDQSVSDSPRSLDGSINRSESPQRLVAPGSPTLAVTDSSVPSSFVGVASGRACRRGDKGFTVCDVARHKTADDCWLIAHGVVYDVTHFIPQHPGGTNSIIRHGGTDSSEDFDFHSRGAQLMWKDYRVGKVVPCIPVKRCSTCAVQ